MNSLVEFHSKNFNESQLLDLTHLKDYSSSSSRLQYERHHHCQDSHQIIRGSVREKRIESFVFTEFCLCDKPKLSKKQFFQATRGFHFQQHWFSIAIFCTRNHTKKSKNSHRSENNNHEKAFSANKKSSENTHTARIKQVNPANPFTSNKSLQAIAIPEQHH